MDAETRTGVFGSAFLVLEHTPANFVPHPGVPAGGTNFADDNGDFWNQMAAGPINVGEGYVVRPQAGYNDPIYVNPGDAFTFDMTYTQGTLNSGNVVRPIVYNSIPANVNPDGTPNMLSNPYASAIDANLLINDPANTVLNEIYFWEHLTPPSPSTPGSNTQNFSMDDLSMHNGAMGVPAANDPGTTTTPNGVIASGQGFAIKAFANGSVTFKNSMRLTSGNTTLRTPEELETITLKVYNQEYKLGSYTGIAFTPDGTEGLDPKLDSDRLSTFIALYSHLSDGSQQLGIQTRERFESGIKIPMGFASQLDKEAIYVISIADIAGNNLSNASVYLIDNQENTITDLSQQDYRFTSTMGEFNSRFMLQFEQDVILGPGENALNMVSVFPNPTRNILNVYSPASFLKGIEVHDVRGRRLSEEIDQEQHTVSIDLTSLETGIYFVRIDTEAGSVTKKIIRE